MSYRNFESLALILGATAVIGTILLMIMDSSGASEITGQLLILALLFGGLHFGRRGALVSFVSATLIYILVFIITQGKLNALNTVMLFSRLILYSGVAFISGEVCHRFSPEFAETRINELVDPLTGLYNSRYIARSIEKAISEFDRYGSNFSVTVFTIKNDVFEGLDKRETKEILKTIGGTLIDNNIRIADEAARVNKKKFVILFPHTKFDDATYATIRVRSSIIDYLKDLDIKHAEENWVETEIFEYPGDSETIETLSIELASKPIQKFSWTG